MKRLLLRKNIALTTALTSIILSGYGRRAYAACVNTTGTSYLCSGITTTSQNIDVNNANVSTSNTFSLDTTTGDAISISGDGALQFTDTNGTTILTSDTGYTGIDLVTTGDDGETKGSITFNANSNITGDTIGLRLNNSGTGAIIATIGGDITTTSDNSDGLFVQNDNIYSDSLTVTIGEASSVNSGIRGIFAQNNGTGSTTITLNGDITTTSYISDGLFVQNDNIYSDSLTVTIGEASSVNSGVRGIFAYNKGTGSTTITLNGDIAATNDNSDGLFVQNDNIYSDSLTVTIGEASAINSGIRGIFAQNNGTGSTTITLNGDITNTTYISDGLFVQNDNIYSDALTVTIGEASSVNSGILGIFAQNNGTGSTTITLNGDITTTHDNSDGLFVQNDNIYSDALTVTIGEASAINSGGRGIFAYNKGTGSTTITLNGDITATNETSDGLFVENTTDNTSDLTVTISEDTAISAGGRGIFAQNNGTGSNTLTVNGTITATDDTSDGIFIENNNENSVDLTLDLSEGANITSGGRGIFASNEGTGDTVLTINGTITATDDTSDGIFVQNTNTDSDTLTVTTGKASAINSGGRGIFASNEGKGATTITINGDITATKDDSGGLFVENTTDNISNLTVTISENTTISAGGRGIFAQNKGTGETTLDIRGAITANIDDNASGVSAYNTSENSSNITITTAEGASILSSQRGIFAYNKGTGKITLDIHDNVTAAADNSLGIYVSNKNTNSDDLTIYTAEGTSISGTSKGIQAIHLGTGDLNATINGDVTAYANYSTGLFLYNKNGTGLTLTTSTNSTLIGKSNGLSVSNGHGDSSITVNGDVYGDTGAAVYVLNSGTNSTITTGANKTLSGARGLLTRHNGEGNLIITTNSKVIGTKYIGFYAISDSGTDITITTNDEVIGETLGLKVLTPYSTGNLEINVNGDITGNTNVGAFVSLAEEAENINFVTAEGTTISGHTTGIQMYHLGNGTAYSTLYGNVTGVEDNGFDFQGNSLELTVSATSLITGHDYGIYIYHKSAGNTSILLNGDITAATDIGIFAMNNGYGENLTTDMIINTGVNSTITSSQAGIFAANFGNSDSKNILTLQGDITSSNDSGVKVDSTQEVSVILKNGGQISGTTGIESLNNTPLNLMLDGSAQAVSVTGTQDTAISFGTSTDIFTLKGNVSIDGDINGNNGTDSIIFDNATLTLTEGSVISNFENITTVGEFFLNGDIDNTNADVTLEKNSNLHVNGTWIFDSLTLTDGSTLGGNNSLTGNVIVSAGAKIAPGNSIGTINIIGNTTFETESSFEVEANRASADKLTATNNITIDPGASVNVLPLANFSGSHTILTAGGTITGQFDTLTTTNSNNVSLYYSPEADSISLLSFNPSVVNIEANSTLDSTFLFSDTFIEESLPGTAVKDNNFWIKTLYRHSDKDTQQLYAGTTTSLHGLALGNEYALEDHYQIGFSVASINNNSTLSQGMGNSSSEGAFASVYGTYLSSTDIFFTLGGILGYHSNENERNVTNDGVSAIAVSDSSSTDIGAMLQFGTTIPVFNTWQVTPRVNTTYLHTYADGYTEHHGGLASVSIHDYNFSTLKSSESLKFSKSQPMHLTEQLAFTPHVEVGYSQENTLSDRNISGTFSSNGASFSNNLDEKDKNFVNISAGLDLNFGDAISGFVDYKHSQSKTETKNEARAGVGVKF